MNNKINKILLIYWHDERNLNLRKLVYSIHTFIFNHIFAWFWFHYVVVYYSTRNHYMLFIVSVSVFFASSLYLDFRVLDITLTMFTLDFTFIPQRIRLVVLRYRYQKDTWSPSFWHFLHTACSQWNAQLRAVTVGNTLRTTFHMSNSKSKTPALTEEAQGNNLRMERISWKKWIIYINIMGKFVLLY